MNSPLKIIELKNIVEEIEFAVDQKSDFSWSNIIKIYDITPLELVLCLIDLSTSPESEYYVNDHLRTIEQLSYSALMEVMLGLRQQQKSANSYWQEIKLAFTNCLYIPEENYHSDYFRILISQIANLGLPIDDQLIEAIRFWQDYSEEKEDDEFDDDNVEDALNSIIEYIKAMEFDSEYEFYTVLADQITFFPTAGMVHLCNEFFKLDYDIIREGTLLFLLHKNSDIRYAALEALNDPECAEKVSPIGLRRLISIRNWLNENQRGLLDDIIKSVRLCNTQCAPIHQDNGYEIRQIIASSYDGVGASSIFCLLEQEGNYSIVGTVLKEGVGIIDSWINTSASAEDFENLVAQIDAEIPSLQVTQDYLTVVLPHFLSLNVSANEALTPEVLLWMEWLELDIYHPQPMVSRKYLNTWQIQNPNLLSGKQIRETFAETEKWFLDGAMTQSWFESDSYIEEQIQILSAENADFNEALVEMLLKPYREKWQNRFFLLALWAKHSIEENGPQWHHFALISKLLADKIPLINIPAMAEISINTLAYYDCEVYPGDDSQDLGGNTNSLGSPWSLSLTELETQTITSILPDLLIDGYPSDPDFLIGYATAVCASAEDFSEKNWFLDIFNTEVYSQLEAQTKTALNKLYNFVNLSIECQQPSINCELTLDYKDNSYIPLCSWSTGFILGIKHTGGVIEWSNYWPENHKEMLSSAYSMIQDIATFEQTQSSLIKDNPGLVYDCFVAIVRATTEGKLAE